MDVAVYLIVAVIALVLVWFTVQTAKRKGRDQLGWFIFALFLTLPALIAVLLVPSKLKP